MQHFQVCRYSGNKGLEPLNRFSPQYKVLAKLALIRASVYLLSGKGRAASALRFNINDEIP